MRQYYYAQDGESHGPVSPAEFRARGLAPDTLIWLEEINGWKTAAEVPELAAVLYGSVPPRKERREPEPRHVPHPEPAPVQSWQSAPTPARQSHSQTREQYEAQRRQERKRKHALPPVAHPAGTGFRPWRLVFFLLGIGWFAWNYIQRRLHELPPAPPPTETTAPAASPDAPAALSDGHSATWHHEAEEPLKHLTVDYNQPADLTGETTISGSLRSDAREVTFHHLMVQVAFLNAAGELLVKDWRVVEAELAPGSSVLFDVPMTAPAGAESVKVEVLKAEAK